MKRQFGSAPRGTYVGAADNRLPINSLSERRGLDLPDRDLATGTTLVTLGKDLFYFRSFVAPEDMIVTGMAMASTATVSAGLTFAKMLLYHVGHRYNITDYTEASYFPLAKTANDTTLFSVANTLYQRSWDTTGGWPSAVRLVKGQRYAVGYYISGTTAPTVVSVAAFMRPQSNGSTVFPITGGRFSGLNATDIPDYANGGSWVYDGVGTGCWYNLTCDPLGTTTRPLRTAVFGDSYVATAAGWFGFANAQAGSKLLPIFNAGVGGETTAQMLVRIAAVTAVNPQFVVVDGGKNDIAAGTSAATVEANITSILTTLLAAGAKVVVNTQPPTTTMNAAAITQLSLLNAWIKALAIAHVYPADTGTALTTGDGVTQNAAMYDGGLVHPSAAGRAAMANVLAPVITTAVAAA